MEKDKNKSADNFHNGNSKKGEVQRRTEIARRKSEVSDTVGSIPRSPQLTARELFQATTPAADGETDINDGTTGRSNGKTRRTSRNPFTRRR